MTTEKKMTEAELQDVVGKMMRRGIFLYMAGVTDSLPEALLMACDQLDAEKKAIQ